MDALRVAHISPAPWPPRDEIADHVLQASVALARRGHRVSILAPGADRDALAAGRRRRDALLAGDRDAMLADPGEPLVVLLARSRQASAGPGLAGSIDLASAVAAVGASGAFDIVSLHAPLAAGPVLASLSRATGVTAVSFDRSEPTAGVAFVRGLVERALARVDLRIAPTKAAARALDELLPGRYSVVLPGADRADGAAPSGDASAARILVVARDRERSAAHFALRVLAEAGLTDWESVTILGPADAQWRTKAVVPPKLSGRVRLVDDTGPESREAAIEGAGLVLAPAPEDATSALVRAAASRGLAVVTANAPGVSEFIVDGETGVVRPPFSSGDWVQAVRTLIEGPAWRSRLGTAARTDARSWDEAAAAIERCYADALARASSPAVGTILADFDLRLAPGADPSPLLDAAVARGLGAVGVVSTDLATACAARDAAPAGLLVVPGQEIATAEGVVAGLFLDEQIPDGAPLADTLHAIHRQGGLAIAPHPDRPDAPPPEVLSGLVAEIDCHALLAPRLGGVAVDEAARIARGVGLRVIAGSDAWRAAEVGTLSLRLPVFDDPRSLLRALGDAHPVRRRRALRGRAGSDDRPARRSSR